MAGSKQHPLLQTLASGTHNPLRYSRFHGLTEIRMKQGINQTSKTQANCVIEYGTFLFTHVKDRHQSVTKACVFQAQLLGNREEAEMIKQQNGNEACLCPRVLPQGYS